MNYKVRWNAAARNTLAIIWIGSANRRAVTAAQARIDHLLAADPLRYGTSVSEGLYVIEVHPLRAVFEVDATNKTVKVVSVGELA
jgi:hypothetical protein